MKLFFLIFFSVFLTSFLTSCMEDNYTAPVVNAWYQREAASDFYIVQEGDTIYSIAFAFGLDYHAIAQVNHLEPPYPLTPGQRLTMTHQPPAAVSQASRPTTPEGAAPVIVAGGNAKQAAAVKSINNWQWPAKGQLIQSFSTQPEGHPGVSISGKKGESVRAAADGVVVYSGDGVRGYGNLIIVKHNRTYLSAYAFNQQNLVTTGDRVHVGEVIAKMGQNDAGRPLLYFEIRRDGVPVNPLKFLM